MKRCQVCRRDLERHHLQNDVAFGALEWERRALRKKVRRWETVMVENGKVPAERIESIILFIRGQKVILDRDLAELYGVTTGNLNKAVKRNLDRFPSDFMFQLKPEEYDLDLAPF